MNIDFMKLNYTEEDRLKDEIHYEETMIARLNVMLGFAMTPVDLETILHQIDILKDVCRYLKMNYVNITDIDTPLAVSVSERMYAHFCVCITCIHVCVYAYTRAYVHTCIHAGVRACGAVKFTFLFSLFLFLFLFFGKCVFLFFSSENVYMNI